MKKILTDTLMINGRHSQRKWQTFSAFIVASVYAFMPAFLSTFDVKEFVFIGFLGIGGFSIFQTHKKPPTEDGG